jgi:Zinc-binding dehydrogenase
VDPSICRGIALGPQHCGALDLKHGLLIPPTGTTDERVTTRPLHKSRPKSASTASPEAAICWSANTATTITAVPITTGVPGRVAGYGDADVPPQVNGIILKRREVSSLIDHNVLKTTLTEVVAQMDVDTLRAAHQLVETGRTIGKVVLDRF